MSIAARILPIIAALASAGWTAPPALPGGFSPEPVAMHGLQGPPDVRQFYICRVLPKDGGGFCTSPPYAPIGKSCTCDGPHGPRQGVVERR